MTRPPLMKLLPTRGVLGNKRAIAKVAPVLPDRTPVMVSDYCPPDMLYVIRDPQLAAYLRFIGFVKVPVVEK